MPKIKIRYKNGTWFLVPLRDGGFARGVVARHDGKGRVFGYFFGPKLDSAEGVDVPFGLRAEEAVLVGKFGDLGLINKKNWIGNWIIIGDNPTFNTDDWPMPPMIRIVDGDGWLSEYDPETLNFIREWKYDPALVNKYPESGLWGSGAVEIRLTGLLS